MDPLAAPSILLGLAVGLLVGVGAWGFLHWRRAAALDLQLRERDSALAALQADLGIARQDCVRAGAQLDALKSATTEKIDLLQQADTRLREAFSALCSEALKQNNESFLHLARASFSEFQRAASTDLEGRQKAIESLVSPLRESLTKVDTKLHEVERHRVATHAQLTEQLRGLAEAQQLLQGETHKLSRALRSPNVRGQWGELQLRRVLENANLLEGSHFETRRCRRRTGVRASLCATRRSGGSRSILTRARA